MTKRSQKVILAEIDAVEVDATTIGTESAAVDMEEADATITEVAAVAAPAMMIMTDVVTAAVAAAVAVVAVIAMTTTVPATSTDTKVLVEMIDMEAGATAVATVAATDVAAATTIAAMIVLASLHLLVTSHASLTQEVAVSTAAVVMTATLAGKNDRHNSIDSVSTSRFSSAWINTPYLFDSPHVFPDCSRVLT